MTPETAEQKRRAKQHDDAVVVDAEFRFSHLWLHDMEAGESTRLTDGDFTVSDPRWSPDSSRIAFVTRPTTKVNDGWNSDIRVADVASGESRVLFQNPGPDTSPRWSPDGDKIAFTANTHSGTTVWHSKLYLLPADGGGEPEILLEDFDLNAGAPIWAPNGADIYWATGERTDVALYSVQLATDEVLRHGVPSGANFQFQLSHDGGRWVWVHSNPAHPSELYTAPSNDLSQLTRLTTHNAWLAESFEFAAARPITWTNSDGQEIEGVVHFPIGYREGTAYPLIVHPHGGPSGAVMTSFNSTNQMLAANGFLVLQPNFRGSSNYGQEFLNANRDNWGTRDYDDIMTGVDDPHRARLGRCRSDGRVRLELRRLHDLLDVHPDRSLQADLTGCRAHQLVLDVQHDRHSGIHGVVLRHAVGRRGRVPTPLAHSPREERHRQDADHARRERCPRATGAGGGILPGAARPG